jgi:hypothetical protein
VVVPVGGSKPGERGSDLPLIPGDSFVDTASGKVVRVHSGLVERGEIKPSAGGYQSLLDSTVLACEARALDALREYKDAVHSAGNHNIFIFLLFVFVYQTKSQHFVQNNSFYPVTTKELSPSSNNGIHLFVVLLWPVACFCFPSIQQNSIMVVIELLGSEDSTNVMLLPLWLPFSS